MNDTRLSKTIGITDNESLSLIEPEIPGPFHISELILSQLP